MVSSHHHHHHLHHNSSNGPPSSNFERGNHIIDQQVDELRDRMKLLQQDRRANVDLLEANKKSNAEELRLLRDANKEIRIHLSQMKQQQKASSGMKMMANNNNNNSSLSHPHSNNINHMTHHNTHLNINQNVNTMNTSTNNINSSSHINNGHSSSTTINNNTHNHIHHTSGNDDDQGATGVGSVGMMQGTVGNNTGNGVGSGAGGMHHIHHHGHLVNGIAVDHRQESNMLKRDVLRLRTEFDSFKVQSNKLDKTITKLKDEMKLCELEARRPSQEDSPLSRQIRMLENRLDKAMIKYNEAQSIRNTYEHISKRLKDERVSFDNQLSALERTLHSKKRDYEELLLLAGDANHARELATQELQKARLGYEEKRLKRQNEIRETERHFHTIKVRKQILYGSNSNNNATAASSAAINPEDNNNSNMDLTSNNSNNKRSLARPSTLHRRRSSIFDPSGIDLLILDKEEHQNSNSKQEEDEEESKLDIYEKAFCKIKEATGVSDVNEVIQKIIGQESTTENLVSLTKQNQSKIEDLIANTEHLRKSVEELKYSGATNGVSTRKMVDEREEQLALTQSNLERSKSRFDRLSSMLISAKAGVKHIKNKIDAIQQEVEFSNTSGNTNIIDASISDSSSSSNEGTSAAVDILESSGNILTSILSKIKDKKIMMEAGGESNLLEHAKATEISAPSPTSMSATKTIEIEDPTVTTTANNDVNTANNLISSLDIFDVLDIVNEDEVQENRPFNQRIQLPSTSASHVASNARHQSSLRGITAYHHGNGNHHNLDGPSGNKNSYTHLSMSDDDGYDELEDEEISREHVKKNSSQIVLAQERKKTREMRRNIV